MSSLTQRIRDHLVALRMPRALEILDQILRRQEQGEITTIEAIDMLLAEEYALREKLRVGVALNTSRLIPIKTLESFDFTFQPVLPTDQRPI